MPPQNDHIHGPGCLHFCDSLTDEERNRFTWAKDKTTRDAAHTLLADMMTGGTEATMRGLEGDAALFHAVMDTVATGSITFLDGKAGISDILLALAAQTHALTVRSIAKEAQQEKHDPVARRLLESAEGA